MNLGGLTETQLLEMARTLREDPGKYCREVLHFHPTYQQDAVLAHIRSWCLANRGKPFHEQRPLRIAIRSGHGTGKSRLEAALIHWWQTTRVNALTVATAPKASQLQDVVWREFTKMHEKAEAPFNSHFEILNDEIRHVDAPRTHRAIARTARKENPEALQGFHDPNLFIVCEEASGIPEEIFEVGEGALSTPGSLVLMAGNPTRVQGTFYRAFHEDHNLWDCFHFDRSKLDPTKHSFLDPGYPDRMAQKYGRESNVYRVRVLGEFPTADPDTLIPLWQVEDAVGRDIVPTEEDPRVFGLDVARFGDDETVLMWRWGDSFPKIKVMRELDTTQVAYRTNAEAKKIKTTALFVDSIGVGGGVADQLRDLGLMAVDVNVSERPSNDAMFDRLRDELWWRVKEAFEAGKVSIAEDVAKLPGESESVLVDQLSTIKYEYRQSKLKIESKSDRKRRLGSQGGSPDRADALMMTYARPLFGMRPGAMQRARAALRPQWSADF